MLLDAHSVARELRRLGAIVEFVEPPIGALGTTTSHIAEKLISVEYAAYGQKIKEFKGLYSV